MSKRGSIGRLRIHNAKNHGRKRQGPRTQVDSKVTRDLALAWTDAVAGKNHG